jgi:hypothetical protein
MREFVSVAAAGVGLFNFLAAVTAAQHSRVAVDGPGAASEAAFRVGRALAFNPPFLVVLGFFGPEAFGLLSDLSDHVDSLGFEVHNLDTLGINSVQLLLSIQSTN